MIDDLHALLKGGERVVADLAEVTFTCLRNLESISPDEVLGFLGERQKGVDALAKLDENLRQLTAGNAPLEGEDHLLLEKFRHRYRDTLVEIVEADALIRALAEGRRSALRTEMNSVVQGHTAMKGYGGGGRKKAAVGRFA